LPGGASPYTLTRGSRGTRCTSSSRARSRY
jgi:hypothetical protein